MNFKKIFLGLMSIGFSANLFATEIQNVDGTDGKVVTGFTYTLRNPCTGRFLRAGGGDGEYTNAQSVKQGYDYHGGWVSWKLSKNSDGDYSLYNPNSGRFLRAGGGDGEYTDAQSVKQGYNYHGGWVSWKFIKNPDNSFSLQHPGTGRFLRAGGGDDEYTNAQSVKQGYNYHGNWVSWDFIPSSYKLKAVMSEFEYLGNVEEILNSNKKSDYMGEYTIDVGTHTVGSNISRTFEKTISSSFAWGLNQNISSETSLEINAGIPLIGGATTTVSMSASFGSNQDWSSGKETKFSATDVLIPEIPGLYKMSGWVQTAENVELPFKSKVVLTATGDTVNNNGSIQSNTNLPKEMIESLLKYENFDGTITKRHAYDLVLSITGTMTGSYGMSTFTKTEKIG